MKELELAKILLEDFPLSLKGFYHEMKPEGISTHKFRLLMVLKNHPGHPMKFYAERIGIKKSNFTVLIDEVIELGWVERRQSEKDRRKIIIELTETGEFEFNRMWEKVKKGAAKRFEVLDDEEIERLTKAVNDMIFYFNKVNKESV